MIKAKAQSRIQPEPVRTSEDKCGKDKENFLKNPKNTPKKS